MNPYRPTTAELASGLPAGPTYLLCGQVTGRFQTLRVDAIAVRVRVRGLDVQPFRRRAPPMPAGHVIVQVAPFILVSRGSGRYTPRWRMHGVRDVSRRSAAACPSRQLVSGIGG